MNRALLIAFAIAGCRGGSQASMKTATFEQHGLRFEHAQSIVDDGQLPPAPRFVQLPSTRSPDPTFRKSLIATDDPTARIDVAIGRKSPIDPDLESALERRSRWGEQ